MKIKQNRKWALKPEVGIFETRDPAQAEGKLLRIILSYSTALCMVWVKPQFDSNLRQKHPIFGLWEFLENSRGTLEGKFINVFYSARRALSDPQDSLVTKILLVVENFSLSHCSIIDWINVKFKFAWFRFKIFIVQLYGRMNIFFRFIICRRVGKLWWRQRRGRTRPFLAQLRKVFPRSCSTQQPEQLPKI